MSPYAELHAHSYYSLLDGASSPRELVVRAAELGMPALALTDHDALYGAVEFAIAATEGGLRHLQNRAHALDRWRVWREYFRLATRTGLLVVVYHDLLEDRWYLQRVYD